MNVVTVSREYGSGGKEFGRALAECLGFRYIDRILAHELAAKLNMDERYIDHFLDTGIPLGMTSSVGDSFDAYSPEETQNNIILQIESQKLLKKLAKEDNILVIGRAADIILSQYNPFRIFVYAQTGAKIAQYRALNPSAAESSDSDVARALQMVDTERYQHHSLFSPVKWGEKQAYDLCINSTHVDLEKMAPIVAEYAKAFFGNS